MTELAKIYDPSHMEQQWYQFWQTSGYFKPQGQNDAYTIMLPPPNITGSLHMGHGFGFTLIDILIRYHRMCGYNTLWQPGTDHAGIATQMVVERQLNQAGKTRQDLGREQFIAKIWQWKQESGGQIGQQLRRLGASLDWSRECFTMDADLSVAVRTAFIALYEQGLIYRGLKLVNWDPSLLTAISDLEVINQEEAGYLWYIKYPIVNHTESIVVATTRPETILGDMAVAVHPDDNRYQHLIGQHICLPLSKRIIPIIADSEVDPEFGTGCVKITPAHDFTDYAIALRHNLEQLNIFTPTAHLNENVPPAYQGLERFAARKQIIADLTTHDYLQATKPHKLMIPRGDRSNTILEPYLTPQWYLKSKVLAEPAIAAVKSGKISFIPKNWAKTYFQWMDNIEDWCISRQLWWGHRIPIWYDENGNAYAGHDEAAVRQQHNLPAQIKLNQDEDVLDTWFSAALWPFSSLGWPSTSQTATLDLKTFFPTTTLVTGFDIIFFWVARMIMFSLKFTGQIPFKEIYITGLIRDADGHKMSKSKGNVLDPIDLIDGIGLDELIAKRTQGLMQPAMTKTIEKNTRREFSHGIASYGTDALRFTFCSLASYTREIRFDLARLAGYRNFCNKLWNAARYILMNMPDETLDFTAELAITDHWITIRLAETINTTEQHIKNYRFDLYAQTLYDFTWNEFCDWYLEFAKIILTNQHYSALRAGTRKTLITSFEQILRLLHPIIPFITEELWQKLRNFIPSAQPTIMLAPYPTATNNHDPHLTSTISWLKNNITAIRSLRSEKNIPPGKILPILIRGANASDHAYYAQTKYFIHGLAKIDTITWLTTETIPPAISTVSANLEIFIPAAVYLDQVTEIARLQHEISKQEANRQLIQAKLNNVNFVEKAPPAVVAQEKIRLQDVDTLIEKLNTQLKLLS